MREFVAADGSRWCVEPISHGRTSDYLNPRVHKPILQFTRLDTPAARRYVGHTPPDGQTLEDLSDPDLIDLLARSTTS